MRMFWGENNQKPLYTITNNRALSALDHFDVHQNSKVNLLSFGLVYIYGLGHHCGCTYSVMKLKSNLGLSFGVD